MGMGIVEIGCEYLGAKCTGLAAFSSRAFKVVLRCG